MYYRFEKEKETNRTLKMLTTSVSHEMLGPLGANVQIAERLLKRIKDKELKLMVKTLLISSKLLLWHANDLLD